MIKHSRALALLAVVVVASCNDRNQPDQSNDYVQRNEDVPTALAASVPPGQRMVFFDDFQTSDLPKWEPMVGDWDQRQLRASVGEYAAMSRGFALSYAGASHWSNYELNARVTLDDDRQGPVGVVGRGQGDHFYYELVIGRDDRGIKSWLLRERADHSWTILASGPFDYQLGTPYSLRLAFRGLELEGSLSRDGKTYVGLGKATLSAESWQSGRVGVVTYGGAGRFDDVTVTGDETIFLIATNWGPVALLRDNTTTFPTGKPSGGWFVTPIHATLRASDGKVLISGFSRKAAASCANGSTTRQNGTTWVLTPSVLDSIGDGGTLQVSPMNEANAQASDVMYCSGQTTMADGRIFFSAGTRYPDILPDASPERGLRYSRIYNGSSITRISALTSGGQSTTYPGVTGNVRGEKWYPTVTLLPDTRVMIFGGFHYSAGGPTGTNKDNRSFEIFDPAVWDANNNANPYTVLTQHEEGSSQTTPSRGYTNVFVLPKPVPAASGSGFARQLALLGGFGKVFLYDYETGPTTGGSRLVARPNALSPNPSTDEKGEGASGVLLHDGRLLFTDGGHDGAGSSRAYFYDPYGDSWTATAQLNLGISRMYGDAVQLPDGSVIVINGYNNSTATNPTQKEPGNEGDIVNPVGDAKKPVLIDPYATPPTAVQQTAWPEPTHRGYHSVALLLKDGRILVGGGKDGTHITGCEKNELRIYTPPYLQGSPTRPTINNIASGQMVQVGSGNLTVNYTGTLKSTRGVVLMGLPSITHAFDSGQRYVPLTVVSGGGASGSVVVQPPANTYAAPPGDYLMFIVNSAGVPSTGVHVRLTLPAPCVFAIDGNKSSYLEAEVTSRRSGPFTQQPAAGTSGPYLKVDEGSGSHQTAPDEGKVLWYDVNVTSGGTFNLWALVNGPDVASDSFWVSVDSNPDVQLSLPAAAWAWVQPAGTLSLSTGKHTLKIKVREDGALIDKLLLTRDTALTPTGLGPAGLLCNGPPASSVPPNAPTNLVATGQAGQATLTWTDGGGAETQFKVERKLTVDPDTSFAQVGTTGANVTTFVNGPLAPGDYTWRVRASNASGDSPYSNTDGAIVTPAAGPAAPSNLVANVTGGNSAVLAWSDNSSNETGFRIEKKVGAGSFVTLISRDAGVTTHTDTPLTPGTYTYRVIATGTPDSSPSNEATAIIANPVADTYVKSGTNASTNFGNATVIEVKLDVAADTKRNGFLRFSLAGVTGTVTSAKLRLFGHAQTAAKLTNVHSVADITWAEGNGTAGSGITWNTPTTDAGGPAMSVSPLAGVTVAITDATWEWDVTAYVQSQVTAGATAVSLGVKSGVTSSNGQTTFNSKEGTNKPVLVIGAHQ